MYCVNVKESDLGPIVFVCDTDLLDKELFWGSKKYVVKREVYCLKKVDEAELIGILRRAISINFLGTKTIELAVELGIIHPKAIKYFEDKNNNKIPYAIVQIMNFSRARAPAP